MGNASLRQTTGNQYITQDLRNYFQNDLPKFILQAKIGNGKFMKTFIMRVDSVPLIVKVYMKLNEEDLLIPTANLTVIWKTLSPAKYPNLLPYQMWVKSSSRIKSAASPVYLIRQFFHANLYDRLSTRPFLNELEKLWILFQLFKCLEICHSHSIVHGDIKPENVMCTTSNWVVLTDFSPFKPAFIPNDDPTDFQYYFDCMGRHRCYLAPERFDRGAGTILQQVPDLRQASRQGQGQGPSAGRRPADSASNSLTQEMDVFALGCLMAEVFLDGVPLLDLPGMLRYVDSKLSRLDQEDSPAKSLLTRIQNVHVRNVIIDMTQKDPSKRLSITEYLQVLQGNTSIDTDPHSTGAPPTSALPPPPQSASGASGDQLTNPLGGFHPYFGSSLYPLFLKMHWNGVSPDERINIICQSYSEFMRSITGIDDIVGTEFFTVALQSTSASLDAAQGTAPLSSADPRDPLLLLAADKTVVGGVADIPSQCGDTPEPAKSILDSHAAFLQSGSRQAARERTIKRADGTFGKYTKALLCDDEQCVETAKVSLEKLSTADLLRRSEELIRDIEEQGTVSPAKSYVRTAHDLVEAATTAQYGEEDILKAPVSKGGFNDPSRVGERSVHEGLVIVVDLLFSNFRHLRYPQSKLISLMLLVRVGRHCSDAVLLQRIVPLLIAGLEDQTASVRAMSVRSLRHLLVIVRQFSSLEANIFPLYIFPALTRMAKDPEPVVRIAFAESIGSFAETAKRFLDSAHLAALNKAMADAGAAAGASGASAAVALQFPYDQKLEAIKDQVSRWIRDLIVESAGAGAGVMASSMQGGGQASEARRSSTVKRILLMDIMRLCEFFGQESTMDKLLTQLLTFLNDQDWELRHAFCAKIPSVCAFLGPTVTAECILPCVENAIYDVEEKVVLCALHSLTSLVELQLLSNFCIVDFVEKVKCLLLHPSEFLRLSAVSFLSTAASALGQVDAAVFVLPLIRETLRFDLSGLELTTELLQHALAPAITRRGYRTALLERLSSIASMYRQTWEEGEEGGDSDKFLTSSMSPVAGTFAAEDDASKLQIIHKYLDLAAREINTKTLQWRNGMASANHVNSKVGMGPVSNVRGDKATSLFSNSLLDLTALSMPEHGVQSLLVPHQKYGIFLYRALTESMRRADVYLDLDSSKNNDKFRRLFGLVVRQGEAARALVGGGGGWEPNLGDAGGSEAYGDSQSGGSLSMASRGGLPAYSESIGLLRRIKALDIPPLPPDTGILIQPTADNRVYSSYTDVLDTSCSLDAVAAAGAAGPRLPTSSQPAWRPKEGVLLTTLREHSGAVNRLVVSPDQAFFASASADTTVKIWPTRQLDRAAVPRSAATYRQHRGAVLDMCAIENSHSVASVSADGSVHVWRVDMVGGGSATGYGANSPVQSGNEAGAANISTGVDGFYDDYSANAGRATVSGSSQLRVIDPREGAAVAVNHFNNDICSMVTYATERGGLHGWDLRAAREAMHLHMRPELGSTTSMTLSPDRNWMCLGTSEGFVSLFDIRYNVPCKLWRHSSASTIHRLACCKTPRGALGLGVAGSTIPVQSEGAFLFVAAGQNEAAVWGIPEGGECCKCFRSVPLDVSRGPVAPLPTLTEVALPRHPSASIRFQGALGRNHSDSHSVRAIVGRISTSNTSYLVTAGTDRSIRFWDFSAPSRCFTLSGLEAAQPKAIFDAPKINAEGGGTGKLFVCYVAATPSADKILQSHLPIREGRGVVLPSVNTKDAVLDLKTLELPLRLVVSGGRDGEIKLWK
ncbi:hypothetical protein B484DRAFT_450462 [Ochromonadaceae sp. CCMP2298]|nr:hypothetical protein B484DRAFT_450462 [Ochromonadaceae sp. CCMP2298]